jgi:hypothetical protein
MWVGRLIGGDDVERAGATASLDHVPSAKVLYRKTKWVKFNGNKIINSKLTNRHKVFNYIRNHKKVFKKKGTIGKREVGVAGGRNR